MFINILNLLCSIYVNIKLFLLSENDKNVTESNEQIYNEDSENDGMYIMIRYKDYS